MRLHRLIEALRKASIDVRLVAPPGLARSWLRGVEVIKIVTDSRGVTPGAVFCALSGAHANGEEFIADAARRGAVAAITENDHAGVPPLQLVVPDARAAMRKAAWALWGRAARVLRVAAVTGTNGKTTTATLFRDMLRARGDRVGLVGTLGCDTGRGLTPTGFTTPETAELLGAFADMRGRGMSHAVIEASSHALELGRLVGIDFDVAVFTNLTREHLDFHGDMASYLDAKAILFEGLAPGAVAVLNCECAASAELAGRTRARVLWTGLGGGPDVRVPDVRVRAVGEERARVRGIAAKRVRIESSEGSVEFPWFRPGGHNMENLASAAGAALAAGVPLADVARAAEAFPGVPGRLEYVDAGGHLDMPFDVLVDYAHTPDALETVLASVKRETRGRLVTVFGCGGDRDRTKRPAMGRIAERVSDVVVVTSDNPRSEDPGSIVDEIVAGMSDLSRVHVEVDREQAIVLAVGLAREGDVVVIAGKGHETEQIIGDERLPFDDREVARRALRALGKAA